MRRNGTTGKKAPSRLISAAIALGIALSATSCSSLFKSARKSQDTTAQASDQQVKWVSKAQYDDLMIRYKDLNDRYEKLKDESLASSSGYSQVDELANTSTETVDVFAKDGLAEQAKSSGPAQTAVPVSGKKNMTPQEIEAELEYFKRGLALESNGKTDEALKIFQYLDRSSTEQVRVRARARIGAIYMQKEQYDLALQVFETIIQKEAFSGKVLDALEGAVAASDKLNLGQKKLKYQSILKDFFGMEG